MFRTIVTLLTATAMASTASAHFIFVVPPEPGGETVRLAFGEGAEPPYEEAMREYVEDVKLFLAGEGSGVELTADGGTMAGSGSDLSVYVASKSLGVMSRGDETFLLKYYAKGGPRPGHWAWRSDSDLKLDIVPGVSDDGRVTLTVTFDGKPAEGAEVVYETADDAGTEDTDGKGVVVMDAPAAGLASVRAKFVEKAAGDVDGKKYDEVRHYCTLTFHVPKEISAADALVSGADTDLPDLPRPVTSFGATRLGNVVYAYGGHTGSAHSYSKEEQANELWALDLSAEKPEWRTVATGEHVQGNALVAAGGKVLLIGGFTAENAEGEDHNLQSKATVRGFDPKSGEWTDLPELPQPRSSFDAAVIGDTVYVVGGWAMAGDDETQWHDSAWSLDLSEDSPTWQPIADPPFRRRALAVVAYEGKVYALGGMSEKSGPTTRVNVYDPASDSWSEGPKLLGESMNGFGCAGFSHDGRLYVTSYDGAVQRLSEDGQSWEVVGELPKARFFHRIIPSDDGQLVLGGGDMTVGKFPDVDLLEVKK